VKDKNRKHAASEGHERGRSVEIGEALKARSGQIRRALKACFGYSFLYSAGAQFYDVRASVM
jgi:hypothetical protein